MYLVSNSELALSFGTAKDFLWDGKTLPQPNGKHKYICYALNAAAYHGKTRGAWADAAQKIIRIRLDDYAGMYSWLRDKGIPEEDLTIERVQAHRLAWLNLLERIKAIIEKTNSIAEAAAAL